MKNVKNGKKVRNYLLESVFILIVVAALIPLILNIIGNQEDEKGTKMEVSMAGFTPSTIRAKAGEEITITFINPDNSAHSDGGGWHQFSIDELDMDYKISPESTKTITIKVDQPGEYEFYCDICCGGRENPTMQGKLIIA